MKKAEVFTQYDLTFSGLPFTIFKAAGSRQQAAGSRQQAAGSRQQSPYTVNLQAEITSLSPFPATITKPLGAFCPFTVQNAPFCVLPQAAARIMKGGGGLYA